MEREEWLRWRDYWHKENLKSEEGRNKWKIAQSLGIESSICSVQGCLRDAIGFMWADEEDIQALKDKPGLIDKNKTRAVELRDELQKCIFHTDKENEIWIANWDGEMERWKIRRNKLIINLKSMIKNQYFEEIIRHKNDYNLNKTIELFTKAGIKSFNFNIISKRVELDKRLYERVRSNFNIIERIISEVKRDMNNVDLYIWKINKILHFWENIKVFKDIKFDPSSKKYRWGIINNPYNFSRFRFITYFYNDSNTNEVLDDFWKIFENETDFSNATFIGDTDFRYVRFLRDVNFQNSVFIGRVSFWGADFMGKADFSDTIFMGYVEFSGALFRNDAIFVSSIFMFDGIFTYAIFENSADFSLSIFNEQVDFSFVDFRTLVSDSGTITDFTLALFTKEVYFSFSISQHIMYFTYTQFKGYADFGNSNFMNILSFYHVELFRNLDFSFSRLNNLIFYDIDIKVNKDNVIYFYITNIYNLIMAYIKNSSMRENIAFFGVDISYGIIYFRNIILENARFNSVNWGEVSTQRICHGLYERDPLAARDIYRQIKLALDKQENYIDARKFYALELQAYGRELEIELRDTILETRLGRFIRRVSNFLSERLHTNAETIENAFYSHVIPYLYGLVAILGFLLIPSIISVPHHLLTGFREVIGKSVELWQAHQLNFQNLGKIPIFSVINPIISATILLVVMWLNIWIHLHLRRLTGSLSRNPLADILIYRLYGLTADFGLSWIRPLIGLFITFGVYYLLYTIDFGIHYRLGWLSILLEPYNSIASIFPLLNGLTANGHVSPFSALILYTLIAYFIYQTVLALRRRVRR